MTADLDNLSIINDSNASGEASISSLVNQTIPLPQPTTKKKRNLPGMPDPDAEVIAMSPNTLLATNRFVCEICNKGFQRDQNLQLHRRGHNLPWNLKQRSSKEVKKRVYVCPEPTCVHHDPSRALGDLTGIKKHFCRKHGEKKWKCDKCSKKYAVQSDWKAHSKICGTREYRCDCGTLFSRRDSFITHRAFCDALAEERSKAQTAVPPAVEEQSKLQTVSSPPPKGPPLASTPQPTGPPSPLPSRPPPSQPPTLSSSTPLMSAVITIQSSELLKTTNSNRRTTQIFDDKHIRTGLTGSCSTSCGSSSNGSTSSSVFESVFVNSTSSGNLQPETTGFEGSIQATICPEHTSQLAPSSSMEPVSIRPAINQGSSIFESAGQELLQYAAPSPPAMSATALLQKAAQIGAAATNASLLRGLGFFSSASSSTGQQEWNGRKIEPESSSMAAGLGLGLANDGASGLKELMHGTPSVFSPKYPTLDLLGLGMAAGGGTSGGLSALMTSIGGGLDVTDAAASFAGGDFTGKDLGRSSWQGG